MPTRRLPNGLTEQQDRFVTEYLIDCNNTQAAIRAGYSKRTAHVQGCRLLKHAKVQAAIIEGKKLLRERGEVSAERVIEEYKRLAFANLEDYITVDANGEPYVDLSGMTREQAAALAGAETVETVTEGEESVRRTKRTKLRFHSKQAALDALSRHLGLFEKDNSQKTSTVPVVIINAPGTNKRSGA